MQKYYLGKFEKEIKAKARELDQAHVVERLWKKDPSLWSDDRKVKEDISERLGWLYSPMLMKRNVSEINSFVDELKNSKTKYVVLLGMGASSLTAIVADRIFEKKKGLPRFFALDSTDPDAVLSIRKAIDIKQTLFIVASKSGSTIETMAHFKYFYDEVSRAKKDPGWNFAAITDSGTSLEELAREKNFRRVFINPSDIGGRYAALSYVGLVPMVIMGVDIEDIIESAITMAFSCKGKAARGNKGVFLGVAMAGLALNGMDKLTFVIEKSLAPFGLWLEQLIAESTGKFGKGIVPIVDEALGEAASYGKDRCFVYIKPKKNSTMQGTVNSLRRKGFPVIKITLNNKIALGGEFLKWEIATAIAGSIFRINPFDQPNVKEAKDKTNEILAQFHKKGAMPQMKEANGDISELLKAKKPSDYLAILAYVDETKKTEKALQELRGLLGEKFGVATTLGYGPRYLHSIGQLYKGGPKEGLFIEITKDDAKDIKVPDEHYTFGQLKMAQALGDLETLAKHGKRIVRIHIKGDVVRGIKKICTQSV